MSSNGEISVSDQLSTLRSAKGYPLRKGRNPDEDPAYPGHGYEKKIIAPGVIFERDVAMQLRDGTTIYLDIFRPDDDAAHPVLLGWAPFGKHPHVDWDRDFPGADIPPGNSNFTAFEAVDPLVWVPWGYVVVNADARGTRYSEGISQFMTEQEGLDEYDCIEWLATQPWSTGKLATMGVSYLAMSAYQVAALKPPHLTAVVLFEALNDFYRDVKFHGGIPSFNICHGWMKKVGWSRFAVEDIEAGMREHPLYDEYWTDRVADLSKFDLPVYAVSSWANQGIHTRGTLQAWDEISSQERWLDLNGRKEWAYFYERETNLRMKAFCDKFLLGDTTALADWDPVRVEIRESYGTSYHRGELEYPMARTEFTPLFLNADTGLLSREKPDAESATTYDARSGSATFDFTFDERTEVVGPAALRVWISPQGSDDADIFVGLKKFDAHGNEVHFEYLGFFNFGIVAMGWLRMSHRALDPLRSRPEKPFPAHTREDFVYNDSPVYMEIPILDSGTVFNEGERIQLVIQGHDIIQGAGMFPLHTENRNKGKHGIHTGATFESSLLLPIVPPKE